MKNLLFVAMGIGMMAFAQNAQAPQKRLQPQEIQWPKTSGPLTGTSGVSGLQTIVLKGDASKPGLYTIRLRLGPNTKIQPHSHRDDRVGTVISGTWYFGYGREFSESALKALPPGSFYTEPPGVTHFAMTKEEVVVEVTGIGPSDTNYVDPRNDPNRKN